MLPYERAAEVLEEIGQITISDTSVWRRTQEWGEQFRQMEEEERERANTLSASSEERPEKREPGLRMGAAMDGGMIHIRGEGWKELKVGTIFRVGQRSVWDEESGEWVEVGSAQESSYVAYLGGAEAFGEHLWAEAQRRGWERASETEVVGDGAPWVWNLAQDYFYDSYQVVDWYHAAEHLMRAAQLLYGEGSEAAQRWYREQEEVLYQGHALRIAQRLEKAAEGLGANGEELRKEAGYFYHNHRRMNYMEMREEGWLIGSGPVESGVKQFRDRFTGAGMRWSREGAERLLPIRAAIMSQRLHELWPRVYNSP